MSETPTPHPEPLSREKEAEMRRLCEAATPGPWESRTGPVPSDQAIVFPDYDEDGPIADCFNYDRLRAVDENQANARFIAAARNHLPALLDQIAADREMREEAAKRSDEGTLQERVADWMLACFGAKIAADRVERNHRFLEEALELVQACGCTKSEAHQLVDYVYDRPQGDINQEVGGVMITLAALCLANGFDMHTAGETELARIWTRVDTIRAKQAAKPPHSPLPEHIGPDPDTLRPGDSLDTHQDMAGGQESGR